MWYLETNKFRHAMAHTQHAVGLFLTLKKHAILLPKHGIVRGHLPNFVKNFIRNRKLMVRLLHFFSDECSQECSQGIILSITLRYLMLKSQTLCLHRNTFVRSSSRVQLTFLSVLFKCFARIY